MTSADETAIAAYAPVDATRPTLTITSPTSSQRVLTSSSPWLAEGTARDNIAVTNVQCQLNGGDWVPASTSNHWTNWSLLISPAPGTNVLCAYATDFSGNSSKTNEVTFVYVTPTPLGVQFTGKGTFTPNYTNDSLLEVGRTYSIAASGSAGHAFANWVISTNWSGGVTSTAPTLKFMMESNLTVLANFKDVTRPALKVTNLVNNQQWGYSSVPIKGWAKDNAQVTNVQYRLGSGDWLTADGTTQWSGTVTGLVAGAANTLSAFAQDSSGLCSPTSVVQVVDNPFLPVNGTYNGLFSASNALYSAGNRMHESSGFLKLTVSGKGSYSGSLVLAGKSISLKTRQFDANGLDSQTVVSLPPTRWC